MVFANVRAAIYARVSTDAQAGVDKTSLSTQIDRCRHYLTEHGYEAAGEYLEVRSGYELWERPQMDALRAEVRAGHIQVVIAYAVDRVSRSQRHWGVLLDEAERHGGRFEFVTEKFEDTPEGRLVLAVRTYAAEVEREKIAERTMRGKRAKLAAGQPLRSRPTYGYEWDAERHAWAIVAPQAGIVARVFATLADGGTISRLCRDLTNEDVPTPAGGRQWWPSTLAALVKNPAYKGQPSAWRWRKTKHAVQRRDAAEWIALPETPALVPPAIWQAAQDTIARNRLLSARNNRHAHEYLLRGLVICEACGGRMWTSHNPKRRIWHYQCGGFKQPRPTCDARTRISARWLDARVWSDLVRWATAKVTDIPRRPVESRNPERARLETQLRRRTRERDNLLHALANAAPETQAPIQARYDQAAREVNDLTAAVSVAETPAPENRSRQRWLAYRDLILVIGDQLLPEFDEQRRRIALALGITVRVGGPERYVVDGLE